MNSLSEITLLIAVIALALWPAILVLLSKRREKNMMQLISQQQALYASATLTNKEKEEEAKLTTEELVVSTLKKIGCSPEKDENGNIAFMYQGDDFYVSLQEDSPFIMIWYPWWGTISSDNPTLPYLKEVINAINISSFITTVVMGEEDDDKEIGIHSHCHTFFAESEFNPEDHLKLLLDSFFDTRDAIKDSINKIGSAISEEENKKERVIVKGFSAYKEKSTPIEKVEKKDKPETSGKTDKTDKN